MNTVPPFVRCIKIKQYEVLLFITICKCQSPPASPPLPHRIAMRHPRVALKSQPCNAHTLLTELPASASTIPTSERQLCTHGGNYRYRQKSIVNCRRFISSRGYKTNTNTFYFENTARPTPKFHIADKTDKHSSSLWHIMCTTDNVLMREGALSIEKLRRNLLTV